MAMALPVKETMKYATAISPLPINAAIPDFEFDVYLELGISDDLFGIWNLGFGASAGGLGFGICLGNYFLRRIREIISSDQGQTALFQQMSPFVDIGSFEAHDQRDRQLHRFSGVDDPLRDDVAFHDSAENVHEDRLDVLIRD